jgi:hypothetical protein
MEDIAGSGSSAVLLNCSPPEAISKLLPELISICDLPVGAYANAFTPIPKSGIFMAKSPFPHQGSMSHRRLTSITLWVGWQSVPGSWAVVVWSGQHI